MKSKEIQSKSMGNHSEIHQKSKEIKKEKIKNQFVVNGKNQ